jgi:hypothetical protein
VWADYKKIGRDGKLENDFYDPVSYREVDAWLILRYYLSDLNDCTYRAKLEGTDG